MDNVVFDGFSRMTGGLSPPRAEIQLPMPFVPMQSGYPKPDGSWVVLVNNTGVRDSRRHTLSLQLTNLFNLVDVIELQCFFQSTISLM